MKSFIKILMLGVLLFSQYNSHAQKAKILFVVTSHQQLGNTGKETGYYLSEVAHPWEVLTNAGYEIDIVSPKAGQAPVDGFDLEDKVNKAVWEDPAFQQKIQHTLKPEAVKCGGLCGHSLCRRTWYNVGFS
ncbi:hypothetical protein [Persicobacter diffluens]|uniref:Type 1 glutamine amidotransferase domain-containing protein n=1 Tax=Persicobacter diffluens TaxID=981 RepID=A0AAN4W4I2_9BACT|nr:hypothetical protein PEDI_56750 [Persicobacter diffluens]